MAATIVPIKTYGASGAQTEVENATPGLLATDDNAAPASSPIVVPSTGTAYSYECWMRFKCTVAPDNQVTNFKVWSSGSSLGTGRKVTVNTDAVAAYATPVITQSAAGTRADFASRGSGSKISVAGTLTAQGQKTDFLVFQLEVEPTSGPGNVSDTVYYSYDEN